LKGGEKLRRKNILLLVLVCALSTITLVSALTVLSVFTIPMKGTVATQGNVAITIDGQAYTDGTQINWNTVNWGTNTKAIVIQNNANTALTPSIVNTNLPSGWTLTLSLNQPIASGDSATGTLTLTVPTSTASGDYSWSSAISVSY
jgi:hypothetical protein